MFSIPPKWDVDTPPYTFDGPKIPVRLSTQVLRNYMYELRVGDRFTMLYPITRQRLGTIKYHTVALYPELKGRRFDLLNDGLTVERIA